MEKHLPAMWETWVWLLGWEDPLEEGMATHSNIILFLFYFQVDCLLTEPPGKTYFFLNYSNYNLYIYIERDIDIDIDIYLQILEV